MKTYKVKSLFVAVLACLGLTSCGDFLEIEPKTFVSEDNFWNEKTDVDQMVIGVYTKMQNDAFIRRCIMWGETRSDNTAEGLNCSDQLDIYRTLREYLLTTNQYADWLSFYSVINQCNTIYQRAPEVSEKDPSYTIDDVQATQGEVAFLRDLCYFYLVRAFKDVPYYTNAIQSDEEAVAIAPTNGDSIVKALILDLEDVVKTNKLLKTYPSDNSTRYNSNRNRATMWAVYALLADLCLWDGQYQKTIDYAQRIIDEKYREYNEDNRGQTISLTGGNPQLYKWTNDKGNGYPLYPCSTGSSSSADFGNVFNHVFGTGNSFESIFELAFTHTADGDNQIDNTACATLYGNYYTTDGNAGKGFLCAHEDVATEPSESSTKSPFDHKYDSRYYTSVEISTSGTTSTAYSAKFVSNYIMLSKGTGDAFEGTYSHRLGQYNNCNWIFYRLTDVMLMKAEALILSSTYDRYDPKDASGNNLTDENGDRIYDEKLREAFALIYAVNHRSIATTSDNDAKTYDLSITEPNKKIGFTDPTRDNLLKLCMKERRRELMFEGKRWFDLLRQCHREGTVDAIKNTVPAKSGGAVPVNYEALFWPYYKYEVQKNTLLDQKPYYGGSDDEGSFTSTK